MRNRAAVALTLSLIGTAAQAGILPDVFFDPTDGRFDTSQWLLERDGLLPVPIVITEPAVGYGGGLGLLYFHHRDEAGAADTPAPDDAAQSINQSARKAAPPSVSGAIAAATQNGTWISTVAEICRNSPKASAIR